MTLNGLLLLSLENPAFPLQVWLTTFIYPQNIRRTSATLVNKRGRRASVGVIRAHFSASGRSGTRRPVSRVLCRPDRSPGIGGHSSGPPLAGRFSRPPRTARAYDSPASIAGGA